MKKYPAIAILEISSIATGILSADAMIKKSPIKMIKSGTVHDGKFLVLVGGSVAAVEESYFEGLMVSGDQLIDTVFLPDIHPQVHDALLGLRQKCSEEAIGIIETASVAATIKSADVAIKSTDTEVVEIRIADHLGGKAFAIFTGQIEDVQTAIRIAREKTTKSEFWIRQTIIPRLHKEMATQIDNTSYFARGSLLELSDGEI